MWIVDTTSDHFQIWLGNDYCTELRSQWVLNWIAENNNPATWIARNIYRHLALCVQSNLPGLERPMQPPFHCPVRQQTLRWWTGSPARRPTHPELSLSFGCFEKPRPKGLQGTTRCCVWEYRNCDIGIMWNHRIYIYISIYKQGLHYWSILKLYPATSRWNHNSCSTIGDYNGEQNSQAGFLIQATGITSKLGISPSYHCGIRCKSCEGGICGLNLSHLAALAAL